MNIKIKIMNVSIKCKVMDTSTGKKIYSMLPIKSKVNTWGKEVYFYIPSNSIKPEKNAKEVFDLGEIAYWNQGNAIAIGFGPTPASKKSEIRLVSAANLWAKANNPDELKKLERSKDGDIIEVLKD